MTWSTVRHRAPLALAALLLAMSACSGGSSDDGGAPERSTTSTTAAPKGPEPGTRFAGDDLPQPVSNLVVVDDLVVYYAPDDDGYLELVAVDPAEGEVRWVHDAAMPSWSTGSPIQLRVIDEAIPIFTKRAKPAEGDDDDDDPYELVLVGLDGTTGATNPIRRPLGFPLPCAARICVDTVSGTVAVDPATGDLEVGPDTPPRVLGTGDAEVLRVDPEAQVRGGDQLESRPQFGTEPVWRRPVIDVFGFEDLEDGYASVNGDRWIAHALPRGPAQLPTYPSQSEETGTLVGVARNDGALLWRRDGVGLCLFAISDDVVATCGLTVTQESAEADEEVRLHAVGSVDPATGRDLIQVETLPYDISAGDRLAVVGADRLAARTASGVQEVDLRAGTAKATGAHRVAWCRPDGDLPEVRDNSGDLVQYTSAGQGRPCTVDASKLSEDALLDPIVDGSLPPVDEVSTVQVGPWVLWAEDGRLEGVATER